MAVCRGTPFNPPGLWGPQQTYQSTQGGGGLSRQWQPPQQQQQQYQQCSQAPIQESITTVYGFDAPQFVGETHTQVDEHVPPPEVLVNPAARMAQYKTTLAAVLQGVTPQERALLKEDF